MTVSAHVFTNSLVRRAFLFTLCVAALAFSGCAGTGMSGSTTLSGGSIQQLAYGVSVTVPEGWVVENVLAPDSATKASLDARVDKGERLMLVSMYHPAATPEGRDALVAFFIVDAGRNFQPETRAATMTQEDLDRYAQAIIDRDREAAARQKSQSNLLSWKVTKTMLDDKMTLIHKGTANNPGSQGILNLCDVNMFLPGGKGLAMKSMSDPAVHSTVDGIINSLHVETK